MKLRNSLILTLSLLCSCVESVDKSKFNKPSDYSDADFQINENLDITFQFYQWAFSYDGLNYIKCDDVTSSDVKGPFNKEKDTNFELFLTDFYPRLEQSIKNDESSIINGKELSKEDYEISLSEDYYFYYEGKERTMIDDKVEFVSNHDVEHYSSYPYFTVYCYLPTSKELIFITAAQFSWASQD